MSKTSSGLLISRSPPARPAGARVCSRVPDGDAHAAGRFVAAVAHQDAPARAARRGLRWRACRNARARNSPSSGRSVMPELLQAHAEQFARGQHFGDIVLDVRAVLAPPPARPAPPASSRCTATAPCAGSAMFAGCENRQPSRIAAMPKTFENVRQTKRFGTRSISRQRGDAGEFVIGLVHQHRRPCARDAGCARCPSSPTPGAGRDYSDWRSGRRASPA